MLVLRQHTDEGRGPPAWLSIAIFVFVYGLWQWAYQSIRGGPLESWLIDDLTARPAVMWLSALLPADSISPLDGGLAWPGGRMMLRASCDGFEMMGLYVSALLVSPISWRRGGIALVAGCALIWAMNQLRIGALYGCARWWPAMFDAMHTLWAPAALIAGMLAMYTVVLRASGNRSLVAT